MNRIADLIGIPFKNGGRDKSGMDCWGLAKEVFNRFGINVPDYIVDADNKNDVNNKVNTERKKWERCTGELPIPALVVFNDHGICNHVGVYVGCNKFIHARVKIGVTIESIDSALWQRKIEGVYVWLK